MEDGDNVAIPKGLLTKWAESCLHMNHHGTMIQRELRPTLENRRAIELAERARKRAWELFNNLLAHGAEKPDGYREPEFTEEHEVN